MSRFYPGQLSKLRELREENSHTLALWYAAHQLGLGYLAAEAATLVCYVALEGEQSEQSHNRYLALLRQIEAHLTPEEKKQFDSVT